MHFEFFFIFLLFLFFLQKRYVGVLNGGVLILHPKFWRSAILTILNLPIHEHGTYFHLFRPSVISPGIFFFQYRDNGCLLLDLFLSRKFEYVLHYCKYINFKIPVFQLFIANM